MVEPKHPRSRPRRQTRRRVLVIVNGLSQQQTRAAPRGRTLSRLHHRPSPPWRGGGGAARRARVSRVRTGVGKTGRRGQYIDQRRVSMARRTLASAMATAAARAPGAPDLRRCRFPGDAERPWASMRTGASLAERSAWGQIRKSRGTPRKVCTWGRSGRNQGQSRHRRSKVCSWGESGSEPASR